MSNPPVKEFTRAVVQTLEEIIDDELGNVAGEKLSGNVVKEAHYQGVASGVRIAINILNAAQAFVEEEQPARDPHPMSKEYMQEAARAVEAKLPDNHGFLLLVSPFGEGEGP